ncbi:unnamed protein product [Calicophoron daubneyi]|uniref:UV radiation resistance-associated gene protein n=1 Tax=Calicophoron daubneyi TaxID=300641 RepID=A0AAV2T5K2_CALDB
MDVVPVPDIRLRLRHLNAVYGRNFRLPVGETGLDTNIKFAISSAESGDLGYFFVSELCGNTINPEWDPVDVYACPRWLLASKAAVFTFFSTRDEFCTILFEIEVSFSGLVMLESEIPDVRAVVPSANQVYFRLGGSVYASPEYFVRGANGQPLASKGPLFRVAPKPSYDFERLQQFLAYSATARAQWTSYMNMRQSMDILGGYLADVLDKDSSREKYRSEIVFVQRRLKMLTASLRNTRSKLKTVADQSALVGERLARTARGKALLMGQLSSVQQSATNYRTKLSQLNRLLSLRANQLIRELIEVFGCEFDRLGFRELDDESTDENPNHTTTNPLSTGLSGSVIQPTNVSSVEHGRQLFTNGSCSGSESKTNPPPTANDAQQLSFGPDNDITSTAYGLGVVAQLLRLLSAILNQPLRYSLDLAEGHSRAKVIDSLRPELNNVDGVYPLFLPRSSALPAYRHALSLLNRDILCLRSLLGLCTPAEQATLYNLKTLFQHCLLDSCCSK